MKIKTRLRRQGRVCHKEGEEVGLYYELQCLKECIAITKSLDKPTKFEDGLLKAYSGITEAQYSERFIAEN